MTFSLNSPENNQQDINTSMFADVHTHLTHEKFAGNVPDIIQRAVEAGVGYMVVNGLNPESNRTVLNLAVTYPQILPALGIYPIDAVNHLVADLPFPIAKFDVDQEIAFIRAMARSGRLAAIGECGLDGHWVGEDTFAEQERVFLSLIEVAMDHDLPLIIHTRKREARAMEILRHHGAKKVDFHCFGGKSKMAVEAAHQDGWWFSIPANARVNQSFTKMLVELPPEKILTETDAPYLPPQRGEINEPANVVGTVQYLAELRHWPLAQAEQQVWSNFQTLFAGVLP